MKSDAPADRASFAGRDGPTAREAIERDDPRLAKKAVAARVDGRLVDLSASAPEGSAVEAVLPESTDGLEVLRHSTAHLLAQAVQALHPGTQVTIGPVIENGFYYDFVRAEPFTTDDLAAIEKKMQEIVRANLSVERVVVDKAEAIRIFRDLGETFKVEIIEDLDDDVVSLYRQGDWIDLCRGPHVPSTGKLGVFRLTSVAGAYWRGDEKRQQLQRIYGTAWATKADLKEHLELLEEAQRRDHRRLGKELELFSFHPEAPGSPFFHPKGAFLYNRLVEWIRKLYVRYGYEEVITPQVCDVDLWKRSGHYENFQENMFFSEIDGREFGVKPMNCPGHTLMYATQKRSYRDLPLRWADFSKLHRYEKSGVLHGLTRVRTFAQDDAHVFCTPEQVEEEITSVLRMAREVHLAFGLDDVSIYLSTRPEQRMGDDAMWDRTEAALSAALRSNEMDFEINEGDGAFYGPKIDFVFRDALRREWQLTTVQLDSALPERFDLRYVGADGDTHHRPVMIHRAMLGSIERFLGILIEHTGGAFPIWLCPTQVRILTVADRHVGYAREVEDALRRRGLRPELDARNEKLGYKIREARLQRLPYMLVIGDREAEERTVAPTARGGEKLPPMSLEAFIDLLADEAREPEPLTGPNPEVPYSP